MYLIIYTMLFVRSLITHGQTNSCDICIIDSICTDDQINFNISISKYCHQPLNTHFTYHTDVHSRVHHYNTTITCIDCYVNISIDPIYEAWDYTLTLKVPEPSKICSDQHVAHCAGDTSRLGWLILGGLSGLGVLFGVLLCSIKYHHGQTRKLTMKMKVPILNP